MSKRKGPDSFSNEDRISRAKAVLDGLVSHTVNLIMVHEANSIVLYSKKLESQIPRSYAANAFNQFRHSLHLFELIRLCAIWDNYGTDRESIPTVADLMLKPELIDVVLQETYDNTVNEKPPNTVGRDSIVAHEGAEKSWWQADRSSVADEMKKASKVRFDSALSKISTIRDSPELKKLQGFRDKFIAHNLIFHEETDNDVAKIDAYMHRYEDRLLEETIDILTDLHSALNRTCFDWKGSKEIGKRRARDLWNNCSFDIPERPVISR